MDSFTADPTASSYTYFYQSAHNADRSVTVTEGAQSSTGPAMKTNFVALAAARKRKR